jgi:hypothetical protein
MTFTCSHHGEPELAVEFFYQVHCSNCLKTATESTSETGAVLAAIRDGFSIPAGGCEFINLETLQRLTTGTILCPRCVEEF